MQISSILLVSFAAIVQSHYHSLKQQIKLAKELQIDTHKYLNKKCDYAKYKEEMMPFWDDFFKPKLYRSDVIIFKYRYSKIFVDFGHEDTKVREVRTWVSMNDKYDTRLKEETIEKDKQQKDEAARCMSGGLMTCDEKTSRCVCMDNKDWLETQVVDINTGKPHNSPPDDHPDWRKLGCFVKTWTKCAYNSYGQRPNPFTCVEFNLCNTDLDKCVPPNL